MNHAMSPGLQGEAAHPRRRLQIRVTSLCILIVALDGPPTAAAQSTSGLAPVSTSHVITGAVVGIAISAGVAWLNDCSLGCTLAASAAGGLGGALLTSYQRERSADALWAAAIGAGAMAVLTPAALLVMDCPPGVGCTCREGRLCFEALGEGILLGAVGGALVGYTRRSDLPLLTGGIVGAVTGYRLEQRFCGEACDGVLLALPIAGLVAGAYLNYADRFDRSQIFGHGVAGAAIGFLSSTPRIARSCDRPINELTRAALGEAAAREAQLDAVDACVGRVLEQHALLGWTLGAATGAVR